MGCRRWAVVAAVLIGGFAPQAAQAHPEYLLYGDVTFQYGLPATGNLSGVTDERITVFDEVEHLFVPAWTEEKPPVGTSRLIQPGGGAACTSPGPADPGSLFLHFGPDNPSTARALVVLADPVAGIAYGRSCLEQFESDASLPDVFPDTDSRGLEGNDRAYFDSTHHMVAVSLVVGDDDDLDGLRVFAAPPTGAMAGLDFSCDTGVAVGSGTVSFDALLDLSTASDGDIAGYNVAIDLPGATGCTYADVPCEEAFGFFFCHRDAVLEPGGSDATTLRCDAPGSVTGTAVSVPDGSVFNLADAACDLTLSPFPTPDGGIVGGDAGVPRADAGASRRDGGIAGDASTNDADAPAMDAGSIGSRADGVRFTGGGGCTAADGPNTRRGGSAAFLMWSLGCLTRRRRPLTQSSPHPSHGVSTWRRSQKMRVLADGNEVATCWVTRVLLTPGGPNTVIGR